MQKGQDMVDKDVLIEDDEKDLDSKVEYVAVDEKLHDDEDDGDERLSEEHRDDEDHDPSESASSRAKRKKDKRKAAIERDKREIENLRREKEEMAQRLAAIEGRFTQQDAAMVDQRLNETVNHIKQAEFYLAEAVKRGDGDEVAKALRYRDQAVSQARELEYAKRQQAQKPSEPSIDPRIKRHADEWMQDNSWYDPKGRDEDSAIVLAIDEHLAREGYRPDTREYWEELQERVERKLPHRFRDGGEVKPRRRGPPVGGTREHAPTSTKKEVYVSPERKKALIEAGYWDDPKKRARALAKMAAWDRENA